MCEFWSITISDIISILALIAAVWAAWAATISNKHAKTSLDEARAQSQENMREQLRAINVSLFDFRMEVLTNLERDNYELVKRNMTRERLLFDDSIGDSMEAYVAAKREGKRCEALKKEYLNLVRSFRADDTYEEATDLLRQIDAYICMEEENPLYEQIRDSLRARVYTGKWMNGANSLADETVNYIDADDAASNFYSEAERLRKSLIESTKKYIETSIH